MGKNEINIAVKRRWTKQMIIIASFLGFTHGFAPSRIPTIKTTSNKFLISEVKSKIKHKPLNMEAPYGKGAEIWPELDDEPITLEDTFSPEQVPQIIELTVAANDSTATPTIPAKNESGKKRAIVKRAISKLLRGAAREEVNRVQDNDKSGLVSLIPINGIDNLPSFILLSLLGFNLVSLSQFLIAIAITSYIFLLDRYQYFMSSIFSSPSSLMPSLPPQGHVPSLVSNPLGYSFTKSNIYRIWLKLGALGGAILPLFSVLYHVLRDKNIVAAKLVAQPLFLIACQAITESSSKRTMKPLPLRILIPLLYNAARLFPLWHWTISSSSLSSFDRILAIWNFVYWNINLFGFLIPFASIKYMRAHFFCVEASEVILRPENESGAGLLPRIY